MSNIALILLIVGVVLIAAELFVPGFGLMGLGGLASIIAGIIIYSDSVTQAVVLIIIALAVILGLFILSAMIFGKKSKFVLNDEEKPEEGYVAARIDKELVGKTGFAETDLRPSGAARIGGNRISVIADGEYISKGEKIRVLDTTGSSVKVTREV